MQKQEDEKLERRLHQVMERIQPDEDAKDRMYLEIMRRASVAETPPAKPKPWYLRWQTSAGACTAASFLRFLRRSPCRRSRSSRKPSRS